MQCNSGNTLFFSNFIIMHSSDLLFELMFLLMLSKVDEDE
ncbi:hypothetical protein P20439_2731 [Pseudoalteromonas sp. BSi20439]|nr:hypothetical protein P20439_2731 [Pseudoalteromonas sp. BSi20439]